MGAEGPLSEAQSRIEHKLDVVIELLTRLVGPKDAGTWMLSQVGDANHTCPVCTQPVNYLVDIMNKVVTRKCGCSTGKQAPLDLSALAPPALLPRLEERQHGSADQQQDGSDSDRGGGSRRR